MKSVKINNPLKTKALRRFFIFPGFAVNKIDMAQLILL